MSTLMTADKLRFHWKTPTGSITTPGGIVLATTDWHQGSKRTSLEINYFGSTWQVLTPDGETIWTVVEVVGSGYPVRYVLQRADATVIGTCQQPDLTADGRLVARFDGGKYTYFGRRRFVDPGSGQEIAVLRSRPGRWELSFTTPPSENVRMLAISAVYGHWHRSLRRLEGFAAEAVP